jgi:hypothetical protein
VFLLTLSLIFSYTVYIYIYIYIYMEHLVKPEIVTLYVYMYAGVSVATGRASHAGKVKGDDPDKERHPGPPGRELGGGLTTHPREKIVVTKTHEVSLGGKGKWRRPWPCLQKGWELGTGGLRLWIETDGGL